MTIALGLWDRFATYLFTEKKLSASNNGDIYLKSRFGLIAKFFQNKEWTRENFNEFIWSKKQQGCSNSYINNLIKVGKHLDTYLNSNILQDYTYFKRERKSIEIITPDEIKKLADAQISFKREFVEKNRKYRAMVYFLGLTGCRIGEMANLKWEDCNETMITFRSTKSGHDRTLPMPSLLWTMLKDLPKTTFVFGERPVDRTFIGDILKEKAKLIGLNKRIYPHILRHSFITEMLKPDKGLSVAIIARLVGHENISSTQNYTHYVLDDVSLAWLQHPILKGDMELSVVIKKVRELIDRLCDKNKISISITESGESASISFKNI